MCGGRVQNMEDAREQFVKTLWRDDSLCDDEKSKIVHEFYAKEYKSKRDEQVQSSMKRAAALKDAKSFSEKHPGKLGCSHYVRACKIKAECCGLFFPCRICHDDACDHPIDRFATKQVMCQECLEEQPVSETCRGCGVRFASYFCKPCRLYDDDADKDIYHCSKCGICRVGKGIGVDVFHCEKCNACVDLSASGNHVCIENCLQVDCPICGEFLFTSTKPGIFLRCGHTMHAHCYEEYIENNYRCPFCFKSILDMESFIEEMDHKMATEVMPEEYASVMSHILCNDCEGKSFVGYHFLHHKCADCGSYNTRVLNTVPRGETHRTGVPSRE